MPTHNTNLFVGQLTVIDCSYFDPIRGIVGESWIVDIALGGSLDEQSMMMDFGRVKKDIKYAIDNSIDHTLVIPAKSPNVEAYKENEQLVLNLVMDDGTTITHRSPSQAVYLLASELVTAETIHAEVVRIVQRVVSRNIEHVDLTIRTESNSTPYYHYTHGLKKHQGNCQRIAHGHRSRIEISIDHVRNDQLEAEVQRMWRDIYIGSREDIAAEYEKDGTSYIKFNYQAQEGEFTLALPKERCYILDSDSTVECISHHLATLTHARFDTHTVCVKAFEGVNKGAVTLIKA